MGEEVGVGEVVGVTETEPSMGPGTALMGFETGSLGLVGQALAESAQDLGFALWEWQVQVVPMGFWVAQPG